MTGTPERPDNNTLAVNRTLLAYERTLMAWIRTATSMITFGFTIYKFFQFEMSKISPVHGILTPRQFAMILIALGIASLLVATVSYHNNVRRLGQRISMTEIVGGCMTGFGIFALIGAILRK